MTQWMIKSKLSPSVKLRSLLQRGGLAKLLDRVLQARITLLHAPAGFGKTSLLAFWREALIQRSVPVAWLSLDDLDADQYHFLAYLLQSCRTGFYTAAEQAGQTQLSTTGSPPNALLGSLMKELGREWSSQRVLILDDFHRADCPEISTCLNQIIASLPDNVHLILATRKNPTSLSLSEHRLREDLLELDQNALRFSSEEVQVFLGSLVATTAPTSWASQIYEKTEGWPVAIGTVKRWLMEGQSIEQTLDQISGRTSALSDYFLEQVFDKLEETEKLFFLKTAILERVNGDVANRLCEINDAWKILENLDRRELFVQSQNHENSWYRYHRLFSEFLQERLRRSYPNIIPDLHRLASEWFQKSGFVSEAAHHGIASGQVAVISDLFETLGGWRYALHGRVSTLEHAMSKIPELDLCTYPRLGLAKIFLLVRHGEIEKGEELFDELERSLNSSTMDSQLECEIKIVRVLVNRYAGRRVNEREVADLERMEQQIAVNQNVLHAARNNLLCAMYASQGRFEDCLNAGDKAIRHFRAMGSVWGETFIYFHEGYACMAQGRMRDGEALYKAGNDLALEHFGKDSDLAAISSAFLADVAYEKNRLDEAEQLLSVALPHIEQFDAWTEVYVAAYTTAMKVARAKGDWDGVQDVWSRAKSTAVFRGLPRLGETVDLQAMEFGSREGEGVDAQALARNLDNNNVNDLLALQQLTVSLMARNYLLDQQPDLAIELLIKERSQCRSRTLIRPYIAYSVLLATTLWTANEHAGAISAFEDALRASLFEGFRRVFIDEGDTVLQVINDVASASGEHKGNRLRDRFLAEIRLEISAAHQPTERNPHDLSPREIEVLRYLVQGRSNREISQAIDISINTVKFHVKNIFAKLCVATRKEAVAASIRLGLS